MPEIYVSPEELSKTSTSMGKINKDE